MGSVNISIKEEAYEFLKSQKSTEKSFSDIILSFKGRSTDYNKFFGILKDLNFIKKEKMMKSFRHSFDERLK